MLSLGTARRKCEETAGALRGSGSQKREDPDRGVLIVRQVQASQASKAQEAEIDSTLRTSFLDSPLKIQSEADSSNYSVAEVVPGCTPVGQRVTVPALGVSIGAAVVQCCSRRITRVARGAPVGRGAALAAALTRLRRSVWILRAGL